MKNKNKRSTRRSFLAQASALAALLGARLIGLRSAEGGSRGRDKDLREANYYSRHDLAG